MNENQPTVSIEAERAVLGCIFKDSGTLIKIKTIIQPDYFYLPNHKAIYKAILELEKTKKPYDVQMVYDKLQESGQSNKITLSYLVDILDSIASTVNVIHYAEIVARKHNKREIDRDLRAVLDKCEQDESNTAIIDTLSQIINKISLPDFFGRPPLTIYDRATDLLENLIQSEPALPSGHNQLDRALSGGFQKGRMYIIDGLTGGGKSTFALNIADDLAQSKMAIPVIILFELTANELLIKSISRMAQIDSRYIESKVWLNERHPYGDWVEKNKDVIKERAVDNLDIYVDKIGRSLYILDDTSGWTTPIIKSVIAQIQKLNPGKDVVLFIDPVQMLFTGDKTADRDPTLRTGLVAAQCKQLARDLYIPVILLSDTTKEAQARKEKHESISLADIRGSFELAQRADVTLHITFGNNVFNNMNWAEPAYIKKVIDKYNDITQNPRAKSIQAYIQVGKQRSGDQLTAFYAWHRAFNHFETIEVGDGEESTLEYQDKFVPDNKDDIELKF